MPILLAPLFMLAAAAAAAPIVLHLLHRRNPKPFPFSTLRFLQEAVAKTRRSHHVTQILVLLLRVLIILLLASAFAMPRLPASGFLPEGPRTLVLVIDGSASMQAGGGEKTHYQEARDWALTLLGSLDSRDRVALVQLGQEAPLAVFPAVSNHAMVRQVLLNTPCGFGRVNLVESFRDLLREVRDAHPRQTVEIHVFSDFQASAWAAAEIGELGQHLQDADCRLFLNRIGSPDLPNAAVASLRLSPEALLGDGHVEARARVTANRTFEGANVARLYIDGVEADQRGLTLYPDADEALRLQADVASAARAVTGRLQLEPDALGVDNARYFVLERRDTIPVLLVDGGEADDTRYLARAMNPQALVTPLIRSDRVGIGELAGRDLGPYAGVFIANAPALSDDLALQLEQYAQSGGLVLLYPGGRADIAGSLARLHSLGGLAATLREFDETQRFRILRSDRPNDLELETAAILGRLPEFAGARRLVLRGGPANLTQYLAFDGADPLAVQVPVGHGSIWVAAVSADRSWSEWPLSPDFVIFHQLLVRRHVTGATGLRGVEVGAPAELRWAGPELELTADATGPDGRPQVFSLTRPAADEPFLIPGLAQPGIVQLALRSTPPQTRFLAVNVPGDESALDAVPADELALQLRPAVTWQPRDFRDMQAMLSDLSRGAPLWPWLLLAAFLLAIAEELIANRRSWSAGLPENLTSILRMRRT